MPLPKQHHTAEDYWALPEGVYRFGTEAVMDTYAFTQTVPSEVLPGFEVNFGEIVARM